jgi:hypothetical protein
MKILYINNVAHSQYENYIPDADILESIAEDDVQSKIYKISNNALKKKISLMRASIENLDEGLELSEVDYLLTVPEAEIKKIKI